MEIAFLMDSLESIDPHWETTSHLMYECNQRGHTVYFLEPHDVYIRDNSVVARMWNITVPCDLGLGEYWECLIQCLKEDDLIFETLTDMDALFLRKNPPLNYQVMELLAPVNDQVFMINSTSGQANRHTHANVGPRRKNTKTSMPHKKNGAMPNPMCTRSATVTAPLPTGIVNAAKPIETTAVPANSIASADGSGTGDPPPCGPSEGK